MLNRIDYKEKAYFICHTDHYSYIYSALQKVQCKEIKKCIL